MVKLLKPQSGSLVLGAQMASVAPGEYARITDEGKSTTGFRHDEATFKKLWDEVGSEVGVTFDVKSTLIERTIDVGKNVTGIIFSVWRK